MNAQSRILSTINRQPTDRVPVDVWLTQEVLDSLKKHLGKEDEYETYQKLGLDKIAWLAPTYGADSTGSGGKEDPWGVTVVEIQSGEATYQEVSERPLEEMEEVEELDDYPHWPDPEKFNYVGVRKQAERAREFGFATIGPWISHFEIYCRMRGLENALMDVLVEPEFLDAALDRIETIQSAMLKRFFEELGDLVDIVFVSDDMGTQESQLMSVDHWKTHFQPRLGRWCDLIHQHGKKVLYHTDGAARPFVPHLIGCGVDILNPIQHICPGMERAELNKDFGDKVIFHGGVENQHVLPHGTVEDVRKETTTCLETLGQGGGYIACSCHNIQAGTPVENVIAMTETVQQWKS